MSQVQIRHQGTRIGNPGIDHFHFELSLFLKQIFQTNTKRIGVLHLGCENVFTSQTKNPKDSRRFGNGIFLSSQPHTIDRKLNRLSGIRLFPRDFLKGTNPMIGNVGRNQKTISVIITDGYLLPIFGNAQRDLAPYCKQHQSKNCQR